jgi:hypothetical protein
MGPLRAVPPYNGIHAAEVGCVDQNILARSLQGSLTLSAASYDCMYLPGAQAAVAGLS